MLNRKVFPLALTGVAFALLMACAAPNVAARQATDSHDQKSNLKILYVGQNPNKVQDVRYVSLTAEELEQADVSSDGGARPLSDEDAKSRRLSLQKARTAEFETFLSQHFETVSVVFADEFEESISSEYDVTIFGDPPRKIKDRTVERNDAGEAIKIEPDVYLSAQFNRASIVFSEASGRISEGLGYKVDWYCLCLNSSAHGMKIDHPIFNEPVDVSLTVTEEKTPKNYVSGNYYNGRDLPETIPMWRVQTEGYRDGRGAPVGLVAGAYGFDDAPDAEIIAAGVNTKDVEAVALGRHGNFFHWGFAASPALMTEEGKQVFINAIHYIAQFDGQKPYSRRQYRASAREKALDRASKVKVTSYDDYAARRTDAFESRKKMFEEQRARGEKLSFAARRFLASDGPDVEPEDVWLHKVALQYMPQVLIDRFGSQRDRYLAYYEANLEHLKWYKDGEREPGFLAYPPLKFVADEDLEGVSVSNRDPEILNVAITMLEANSEDAGAMRILRRYTDQEFQTAPEWRDWYERHRGYLYFASVDGHIFRPVPESRR